MTHSESISNIAKALSVAQGEFPKVAKDKDNPFFKSKYADLATIVETVKPTLAKHQLAVTQLVGFNEGRVKVTTLLLHSSGEWIEGVIEMPVSKADAQGVGSAATYARRYALSGILNIAADEDDDGNAAVSQPKKQRDEKPVRNDVAAVNASNAKAPISEGRVKRLYAIAKEFGWSNDAVKQVLGQFGFEKSTEITNDMYDLICAYLDDKSPLKTQEALT